jgi:hypothetical protein
VKKRVERQLDEPRFVITTYEGVHNHLPPTADPLPSIDRSTEYCLPDHQQSIYNNDPFGLLYGSSSNSSELVEQ